MVDSNKDDSSTWYSEDWYSEELSGPSMPRLIQELRPYRGAYRPHMMTNNAMVASGHYLSSWWGNEMLQRGGNAIDAAVAAGLVINVVHNEYACFSGVAPMILYLAESGKILTLPGVGRWSKSVDPDAIRQEYGMHLPSFGKERIKRSVVPAAPDVWFTALSEYGTRSLSEILEYPIKLAKDGYPVFHFQAQNMREARFEEGYKAWPENRRIYLDDGKFPKPGDVLVQSDLGNTLQKLADVSDESNIQAARDLYYKGDIAKQIVGFYRENGAFLTEEDFASFRVGRDEAHTVSAWGLDIWGCGPWSQGPVLLMAVNMLKHFDLDKLEPLSPDFLHLVVESLKLAFSDLIYHCADPDFVEVPLRELLSEEYGELRAGVINREHAFPSVPPYGDPVKGIAVAGEIPGRWSNLDNKKIFEEDTSFACAIDDAGNMCSVTPSDGHGFNPIVPGLGINVSSRGSQTHLAPDHPNTLEPGKRPQLTPNPFLITKAGKPYVTLGTPGGHRQPQAMLQSLLYVSIFDMLPQQAVEMPRVASYSFPSSAYPHTLHSGLLKVEENIPCSVRKDLGSLGHKVRTIPAWSPEVGGVCMIRKDPKTGVLSGGADPRRESYIVAY